MGSSTNSEVFLHSLLELQDGHVTLRSVCLGDDELKVTVSPLLWQPAASVEEIHVRSSDITEDHVTVIVQSIYSEVSLCTAGGFSVYSHDKYINVQSTSVSSGLVLRLMTL